MGKKEKLEPLVATAETAYSVTQGQPFFNWNKFLAQKAKDITDEEWDKADGLAQDWVTCACGNQCAIIPRDGIEPIDSLLNELGQDFAINIDNRDIKAARQTLKDIEKRSAFIINRITLRDIAVEQAVAASLEMLELKNRLAELHLKKETLESQVYTINQEIDENDWENFDFESVVNEKVQKELDAIDERDAAQRKLEKAYKKAAKAEKKAAKEAKKAAKKGKDKDEEE